MRTCTPTSPRRRPFAAALRACAAACLALAVTPAAMAASSTIASLQRETAVHAYGGVQVWNAYDVATKRWRVQVRQAGRVSTPAIGASKKSRDIDVGPGTNGKPVLAFLQCTDSCRVAVARLDGSEIKVIAGSSRASQPTISGNRVAWVRGDATVMTSTRSGAGRRTLPGAPRRKCYEVLRGGRNCARPRRPAVTALELDGAKLALVAAYGLPSDASADAVAEVRTESVKGGRQELVALMTTGEALQTWIGPSWAKGRLYFYKSCLGDSSGCSSNGGTYRFDPDRNSYALARDDTVLAGFAIDADGRRATTATADCGDDDKPCAVRDTGKLRFKRVGSQLREP